MKQEIGMLKKAGVLVICLFVVGVGFWGCVSSEQRANSNEQRANNNEQLADNGEQAQEDDAEEDGQRVEVFPQLGHSSGVSSVLFSSDGKQILSSSVNETIKLWDVETGREIRTFPQHTNGTNILSLSPDGRQFLSSSRDNTIKLWDITTGDEIKNFSGHLDYVYSLSFSPDGEQFLSGSRDNTIKLWDIITGQEIKAFVGHIKSVNSVAFSPNGKQFLSGSDDGTIKLWDMETGREIRCFSGYTSSNVLSVAFSLDGRQVHSIFGDGNIILWDVVTGQQIKTFLVHTGAITSISISPDGKQVFFNSWGMTYGLLDITTGHGIWEFSGRSKWMTNDLMLIESVSSVSFSPDGKQVLSSFGDGTIVIWDVFTGQEIRTFCGNTNNINSIAYNPDKKHVVSASSDNTIKLWDITTGQEIRTFSGHTGLVYSVCFSPDGKYVLSGSSDKIIKLWDTETGIEIRNFSYNSDYINRIWDINTNRELITNRGHMGFVNSVCFSPNGKQVISGSDDATIKLWDVETGRVIRPFIGERRVYSVCFSSDGKQVISGLDDGNIKLWDVETGREIRTFSGHTNGVTSVSFSSNGRQIISGSWDTTIKLWDTETGNEIKTFLGHTNIVRTVAFSRDGGLILSGSDDNVIKLWDMETGREIQNFFGHINSVYSVTFTADNKRIISGSSDGTTRLWDVATGKEIASFISFTDDEWIVITPDGYYNSSPKGDQYLNVRIENNVYGMDQFAKTFYRPDVVERRLQGLPDPVGFRPEVRIQTASVPPDLRVTAGEVDPVTNQVVLSITATDDIRRISDVQIIVNGRLVGGEELMNVSAANLEARNTRLVASSEDRQYVFTVILQLDPGLNRIEIVAANDLNYGLGLLTIGVPQAEAPPKGDLWLLAIGVDDYADNPAYMDLQYAVSDAQRIINAFKQQEGNRFDRVHTRLITNNNATKQNIFANIGDFFRRAGRNDVAALYVASHGKTDNGVYYFFPSDTVFNEAGEFDTNSVINIDELTHALDIPGRKIVMLDTCESGGVDTNRLVHTLRNRSTVIFTASQEDEFARENSLYGGGFFTTGMTDGLKGEAAESGVVMINSLENYIVERVSRMSRNRQRPVTFVPDNYKDFVISVVE